MSEPEHSVNGFIAVPRSFFADCLWEEKRRFSKAEAFIDLLKEAAFTPHRRFVRDKLLSIERGELAASLRYLSVRWQWNKDTVAVFLKLLEQMGEIRRATRQSESIIILCKYGQYSKRGEAITDSKQDAQWDTLQPPNGTRSSQTADKYKEGKEVNIANKGESECASTPELLEKAQKIVEAYPRREKVVTATNIVAEHLRDGDDFEAMLTGTKAAAAVIRTLPSGSSNRYVPSAVAFFEGKRWADDPETLRRQGDPKTGNKPLTDEDLMAQLGGRAAHVR